MLMYQAGDTINSSASAAQARLGRQVDQSNHSNDTSTACMANTGNPASYAVVDLARCKGFQALTAAELQDQRISTEKNTEQTLPQIRKVGGRTACDSGLCAVEHDQSVQKPHDSGRQHWA
jgi:hypothetical protein